MSKVSMIAKTGVTIDTYLKQAGLKAHDPAHRRRSIALNPAAGHRFGDLIDGAAAPATPSGAGPAQGRTILDYLHRRPNTSPNGPDGPPRQGVRAAPRPLADAGGHRAEIDCSQPPRPAEPASGATDPAAIERTIAQAADKYRLPGRLIESVIRAESAFRPDAVSPAGAQGLMQLMPATARELGVVDPFDPAQNIDGGARYIRQMLDRFDGDLKLALAAYNAGPGTVARYRGNVPYPETQAYIKRVLSARAAAEPPAG
jgi:hypothetical protein